MLHSPTKHRKKLTIAVISVMVVLFFIYLYAFSLPGEWHGDAFLYRQEDGSFRGNDVFADYEMLITRDGFSSQIRFTVNDTVRIYDISYSAIANSYNWIIEINEGSNSVFKGRTISLDPIMLMDENENIDMNISASSTADFYKTPSEDELFPTNTRLVDWAINGTHDVRGNTLFLILIFVFALFLGLDLAFPHLFFYLEHGLDVTGGEPSDFFLMSQKAGRFLLAIAILVCVVLSFVIH